MQSEYAGYIKDLKTGAILGILRKSSLEQIAMDNQEVIKRGQKHSIEFEVLSESEGLKAFNEWNINRLGKMVVGIPQMPTHEALEDARKKVIKNK